MTEGAQRHRRWWRVYRGGSGSEMVPGGMVVGVK